MLTLNLCACARVCVTTTMHRYYRVGGVYLVVSNIEPRARRGSDRPEQQQPDQRESANAAQAAPAREGHEGKAPLLTRSAAADGESASSSAAASASVLDVLARKFDEFDQRLRRLESAMSGHSSVRETTYDLSVPTVSCGHFLSNQPGVCFF
jgi:hypothetical protein